MNCKEIDLNNVISFQEKMIRRTLGDTIELRTIFHPKPVKAHLDESMVGQVLNGLAENARKMMPRGGTVTLQTEVVEVDDIHARVQLGARRGEFVRLTVTDDGLGASAAGLKQMFQQMTVSSDAQSGSALGLALISGMIKRRLGWIEATSQHGSGTTIRIYLPVASTINAQMAEVAWASEIILLVEDEAAIRRMVKNVLERACYNVIEADTGVQALALWEKNKLQVKLLLTDMVMPDGITGRDLAKRLKTSKPSLNVIYTSGYELDEQSLEDTCKGAIRFLHKPYDLRKLLEVIHETMTPSSTRTTPEPARIALTNDPQKS
jgi:CheY-like chemotaxis protein